jgi:hypothetical protein
MPLLPALSSIQATSYPTVICSLHFANMAASGTWLPTGLRALHYGPGSVETRLLSCLPSSKSKAFIVTGNSLAKTALIKDVENLLKGMSCCEPTRRRC